MPPKIKNPEGFRSHIQMWNEGLTRTEFRNAFESVKSFVRTALQSFQANVDQKLDAILEEQKKPGPPGPIGATGPMGPQGPQGIQGEPGIGIAGKDADPQIIVQKIEQDLPALGQAVRDGLELLQGDDRLDRSAIKGLDEAFEELHKKSSEMYGGSVPLSISLGGQQKVQIASALNFTGAGAPTVSQGQNGITTLNFPSPTVTPITITGTIDDSNTSFTASSTPAMVNINGTFYVHGHGVTINGTSITTDNPVGVGGYIFGL